MEKEEEFILAGIHLLKEAGKEQKQKHKNGKEKRKRNKNCP